MPWRSYDRRDPRRYAVHARVALGRRGAALLLLGAMWLAQSAFVPAITQAGIPMLDHFVVVRSGGWALTGVIAWWYAWQRKDEVGFLALYLMPAYRLVAYTVAAVDAVVDIFPGDPAPRAIVGVLTWGMVLACIYLIAGWPEPERTDDGGPRAD